MFLAFLMAVSLPLTLRAQRQTPGRPSFELSATFSQPFDQPVPVSVTGGSLIFRQYTRLANWSIGFDYFRSGHRIIDPAKYVDGALVEPEKVYPMLAQDFTLMGGYMIRIWAPRSRVVVFSAGASMYLGDKFAPAVKAYDETLPDNGFVFGMMPEVLFEVFPARNFSLYASFRPRVEFLTTLPGTTEVFRLAGAFGMKYYL